MGLLSRPKQQRRSTKSVGTDNVIALLLYGKISDYLGSEGKACKQRHVPEIKLFTLASPNTPIASLALTPAKV